MAQLAALILAIPCAVYDCMDGGKPFCTYTDGALRHHSIPSCALVLAASAHDHEPAFRRFPIRWSDGQRSEGKTISFALLDGGLDRICECLDIRFLFRTRCRNLVHAGQANRACPEKPIRKALRFSHAAGFEELFLVNRACFCSILVLFFIINDLLPQIVHEIFDDLSMKVELGGLRMVPSIALNTLRIRLP